MRYTFLLMISLLLSCNNTSVTYLDNNNDTIVGVFDIPEEFSGIGYTEKRYFIIIKNDTSNYTSTFISNNASGTVSMNYRLDPFISLPDSEALKDSSILADKIRTPRSPSRRITYQAQLREIQIILNEAAKQFDLSKLFNIKFKLSTIENLNNLIQEDYEKSTKTITYEALSEKIFKSNIINDLNRLLAIYDLKIQNVVIDGIFYTKDNEKQGNKTTVLYEKIEASIILSLIKI